MPPPRRANATTFCAAKRTETPLALPLGGFLRVRSHEVEGRIGEKLPPLRKSSVRIVSPCIDATVLEIDESSDSSLICLNRMPARDD